MQPTAYIPNLNGASRLPALLESLEAQTFRCDTVVVDNGSVDGSVEMVRRRFPSVEVIALERNHGFGAALNLAIARRPGDPILLLNNDIRCEPGFVAGMLAPLGPGVEMVAGVLVEDDDPRTIDSAGVIADRRTLMAFDYMHGEPVASLSGVAPPFAPSGGAALYSHDAFETAGGFDERIFAYYEDLDLALRMRRLGAGCALAADARAAHLRSATLGPRAGEKYALTGWSRAYLLRRYGIMRNRRRALRTLACEGAICAGQLALDRTAKGIAGRLEGWRAAAGLERLPLPRDGLLEVSVRESLTRRVRRREADSAAEHGGATFAGQPHDPADHLPVGDQQLRG